MFPQLETSANGQFPALRTIVQRTAYTEQRDGSVLKLADPDAAAMEWELQLNGLTGTEAAAIEELFMAVEGRLGTFTFLDPFDNLLRWSEDLTQDAWVKDAGLALIAGRGDPLSGSAAFGVSGSGEISQAVQASAGLRYCFSAYVRGEGAAELIGRSGLAESRRLFKAGAQWKRVEHSFCLASMEENITFALAASGGGLELFGFQVDAQAGASAYKPTASRAGVYNNARFAEDVLGITTEGPDGHGCRVRVRTALD
ncbi:MAG TPA: hypothetical protein VN428_06720 [Bryobacteraceae bacterium]|nr:hypothetical protein [Bryobacteraceae bacterium]